MKPTITVLSLGPGDPGLMTLQTAESLKEARHLVLRTGRHGCAAWLERNEIAYETLDAFYDEYEDFDEMHRAMAAALWKKAAAAPLTYAVMDPGADGSVACLAALAPENGRLTVLPGLTGADACLAAVPAGMRVRSGMRILPASDCETASHDPGLPLMVTELDNPALAGDVKIWLMDLYPDGMKVVFFAPGEQAVRKPSLIPLEDLDRQKHYDHTTCVFIPAAGLIGRERYCFRDLCDIMDILCGADGCPWDREQTHETLRKYLIEEAWEVVGAIDEKDPDHIADELGDVLLQIAFHANIGKRHGTFTVSDVTTDICRKMIYRHAHVFGDADCRTAEDVSRNWEQLKKKEKGLTTDTGVLEDVSMGLPALMRAAKVQKKAAQFGFGCAEADDAYEMLLTAAEDVMRERKAGHDAGEKLGDLLLACANAARLSGQEPEFLLKEATGRLITRFAQREAAGEKKSGT